MHHSILPSGLDSFHHPLIAISVFLESDGSYFESPAEGMIFPQWQKVAEFSQSILARASVNPKIHRANEGKAGEACLLRPPLIQAIEELRISSS